MSRKDKPRRQFTHKKRRALMRQARAAYGENMAAAYAANPPADGVSFGAYWTRRPAMKHGYRRCTWPYVKARRRQARAERQQWRDALLAGLQRRNEIVRDVIYMTPNQRRADLPSVAVIPRRWLQVPGEKPGVGMLILQRDEQNPAGYYADSSDPM